MSDNEQATAKIEDRDPIMQHFDLDYMLAPGSRSEESICRMFSMLAEALHAGLRPGPERAVSLRKLLESRDAAMRA